MNQPTRIQFRQNAGEHERFAPTAFDSQIGKEVPIRLNDEWLGTAIIVAAEVTDNGRAVLLTYETGNPDVLRLIQDRAYDSVGPGMSFRTWPARPSTSHDDYVELTAADLAHRRRERTVQRSRQHRGIRDPRNGSALAPATRVE